VYGRLHSVILSSARKRKGSGVETDFNSPNKRRKNFRSRLEYWEILIKSESGNLTEPCDQIMRIKDEDSRSGGSHWGVYESEEIGEIIRKTFGTGGESGIFIYLRLLKYIYQYIKHLDISYASEVFVTNQRAQYV
jgi:hypothetical protein